MESLRSYRFSFFKNILLLFSIFITYGVSCVEKSADAIVDKRTGIPIHWTTEPGMFPSHWYDRPINAKAESLDKNRVRNHLSIIKMAMNKYPKHLLRKYLKKVYLLKSIEFYGLRYGGTNSTDTLYLTNRGEKLGYTKKYLEGAFHHEFSSILLRENKTLFNKRYWILSNPKDFNYEEGGSEAVRKGRASKKLRKKYFKIGLLCQYSMASIEEDFNIYAEELFTNNKIFSIAEKYPRVRNKLYLMIDFYHKLDSRYTKKSFYRITNTKQSTL